jgi:ssDNA-binding Zn-finger/Zn-ribbon topoisomerase 1
MIQIECPRCEKVLKIAEERAGSAATCPECGTRFRVPELEDAEVERHVSATPQKSSPAPPPEEDEPDEEEARPRRRKWRFDVVPYQPDGGVTVPGIVLMLAIEVLAGVVLGLVSAFIGQWFYLVLFFPILIGLGLGGIGIPAIRLGKVRNPLVGGLIGFFGGCVAWTSGQLLGYVAFLAERNENRAQLQAAANWQPGVGWIGNRPSDEQIREAREILQVKGLFSFIDFSARQGVTISRAGAADDKGMNLGHVGTYIYWAVEFLIMAGVALAVMRKATMRPFCTDCQSWKKNHWLGGLLPPPEEAARAVTAGKLDHLEDHDPAPKKRELRLHVAVCPRCHSDGPLEVRLVRIVKTQGRDQETELAHVTYPGEALAALEKLFPEAEVWERG